MESDAGSCEGESCEGVGEWRVMLGVVKVGV